MKFFFVEGENPNLKISSRFGVNLSFSFSTNVLIYKSLQRSHLAHEI